MIFCSEKVLRYLRTRPSYVATLRTYPYKRGQIVTVRNCNKEIICKAVVADVAEPTKENLSKYLSISGFETVDEWIAEAKKLHRKRPRHLVVLKLMW